MRYLPHTPEEIASMLETVGAKSLDELFESIPVEVRQRKPLDLGPALDETSLGRHLGELAQRNRAATMLSFLGAGNYDHVVPQTVDQLLLRGELFTAYTPYQPEVAQGTLQIIFEFQTIVSEILGLPVANASMYDASTATAEAALMARRLTGRDRTVLSQCVHPEYRETVRTYTRELDAGAADCLVEVPVDSGAATDVDTLIGWLDDKTACVVVGYPGFFGSAADLRRLVDAAHRCGALLVTVTGQPFALALLESPGALGADIAVAEGQALGLSPQFGGPGVGLFACRNDRKFLQQIPGRLVGETVDKNGKRGYVLTLATREQHIRRERATSNICTNSGLCATAVAIKMCLLGKKGFVELAEQCLSKTEYLKERIGKLAGYRVVSKPPTFNELTIEVRGGNADKLVQTLASRGVLAGLALGRYDSTRAGQLLLAVTEKHSKAELDRLVDELGRFAS